MFKSSQKYYDLKNFKIDINFNKNINIIFKKILLEKDKINIDTFIKNIKEKFEARTCFIDDCLLFSFKIANNK